MNSHYCEICQEFNVDLAFHDDGYGEETLCVECLIPVKEISTEDIPKLEANNRRIRL